MARYTDVQFGVLLSSLNDIGKFAVQAEELGFDALACGEHVAFHGDQPSALVALAVAAGVTSKIRLLTAIVIVPLYPAALLAKLAGALDVASGGRLTLGIGVGGEYPAEFAACGVPIEQRGERTDEGLDVITRLWVEKNASFAGRFCTLNDITVAPQPLQRPHPPIWVGGRRRSAMRRALRYGQGWFPFMYTPDQLRQSTEFLDAQGAGPKLTCAVLLATVLDRDRTVARQRAVAWLSSHYRQDFAHVVDKYVLHGDVKACVARLREYASSGADMVVFQPAPGTSLSALRHLVAAYRESTSPSRPL